MASKNKDEHSTDNKQHLNLSYFACEIVESDRFAFHENLSGSLNKVLEYYCPQAKASISQTLNIYQGDLEKILSKIPDNKKIMKKFIKLLVKHQEELLTKSACSYEKGHSIKSWINSKNINYLTEHDSEFSEDHYYPNRGK